MGRVFWFTLLRGGWSILIGLALLFQTGWSRDALLNFMALYWFVSSIVTIRWSLAGVRLRRFSMASGVVGVIASVIVLMRSILLGYVDRTTMMPALGVVILLAGVMHAGEALLVRGRAKRALVWGGIVLGIFEIVLGLVLVMAPFLRDGFVIALASSWAILGGVALIFDAIHLRRTARLVNTSSSDAEEPDLSPG